MTLGLFTTVASGAHSEHIHGYVPASGSLSGYIRHPVPKPGSSSSGSETETGLVGIHLRYPTIPSEFFLAL